MKLARIFALASAGLGVGTFLLFQGCGSSSSGGDTGGGGLGKPPGKPSGGAPTTSTTEHNFAIYQLLLGDAPRGGGAQSNTAWKKFGYNIDGKVSTRMSTDVCKVPNSGPKSVHDNGDNGIDNSFGANILPIVLNTAGNEGPAKINQAITDGKFTIMIDVNGLSDDPKQTNTKLSGEILAGGAFDPTAAMMKPTFTPADNWAVRPEILKDPTNPKSSNVQFTDSYVVNGTYVSADQGTGNSDLKISLVFGGVALDLTVHKAVVTFDHTSAALADNGTIAGVIGTQELIDGLRKVAGRISTSLCTGSAFDGIAGQIAQASDMGDDGTQTPGKECNGISIGLGFIAKQIGNPSKVAPLGTPSPDPCTVKMDAGAD